MALVVSKLIWIPEETKMRTYYMPNCMNCYELLERLRNSRTIGVPKHSSTIPSFNFRHKGLH